jgi:hypothetical protein|tara:strand:- start:2754 stop:3194 length:441 start_codon:yes stop_codon:yes gene_type:complete
MDNNSENPFELAIFEIMKEAIKQASYELMTENSNSIEEEMTDELNRLIDEVTEPEKPLVDRLQDIIDDYAEYAVFAESLLDLGMFVTPEDVVHLMKFPQRYKMEYMLWTELGKPNLGDKEFEIYRKEVFNRERNIRRGKQTENPGD